MRFLAIDLGEKRTGLAVGDDQTGIATPLGIIETRSPRERDRHIAEAIEDQGPDALVIGLALFMDGREGPGARSARATADSLRAQFGLPVHLVDERLSSFAADAQMSQSGLTHKGKRQRRDALAAAVLLRDFFRQRRERDPLRS